MTDEITRIALAAKLVYYGLNSKEKPFTNKDYEFLVSKYREDFSFKLLVEAVADGLSLRILTVEDYGIVLIPERGSLFAKKYSDYSLNLRKNEKEIWGVIFLGLAAYFYPKRSSFSPYDKDKVHEISAQKLDDYIRERCMDVKQKLDEKDVSKNDVGDTPRYLEYLKLIQVDSETPGSRSTSIRFINDVMIFLQEQGMVEIKSDFTYSILPRFKTIMSEIASDELFIEFLDDTSPKGDESA